MLFDNRPVKDFEKIKADANIHLVKYRPSLQVGTVNELLTYTEQRRIEAAFEYEGELVIVFTDENKSMIRAISFGTDDARELLLPGETATPEEAFYMKVYARRALWKAYRLERLEELKKYIAAAKQNAEAERQGK